MKYLFLLSLLLLASCAKYVPPLEPPRYPVSSIAELLKQEHAYTDSVMGPRSASIEKIFWDLNRADKRDSAPLTFTIGDSCFELDAQDPAVLPKLFKKNCGSPQRKLFVDFQALCTVLWPGAVQPISAIRIRPDGFGVAFTSGGKLAAVDVVTQQAAMFPGPAPQEFEWFNNSGHLLTVTNFPSKSVLAVTDLESEIELESIEDGRSYFHIERASSGAYLLIDRKSADSDSWTAIDVQFPRVTSTSLRSSESGVAAAVCDTGDFWIWAKDRAIVAVPNRASATERQFPLPGSAEVAALHCFEGRAVAELQDGWSQRLYVVDPAGNTATEVPSNADWLAVRPLQFFGSTDLVVERQGLTEEPSRCTISIEKTLQSPANCEPRVDSSLHAARLSVKGADGATVPLTVLFNPSKRKRGGNPLLLHAYGAYGVGVPLKFDPVMKALADRGFVLAIANIRGGGPGKARHQGGMGAKKMNAIDDLSAAANYLIDKGFAAPRALYGYGRSGGAAIFVASAAKNPGLFSGLLLDAPLLRPRTVVEAGLELFPGRERLEWGDPGDSRQAAVLNSLDAVESMKSKTLPPVFLTFSTRDSTVPIEDILTFITEARTTKRNTAKIFVLPREALSHSGEDYRDGTHRIAAAQIGFLEWLADSQR